MPFQIYMLKSLPPILQHATALTDKVFKEVIKVQGGHMSEL